jgi:hypothetical protein
MAVHSNLTFLNNKSPDSAVGITTAYELDDHGVGVQVSVGGGKNFHFSMSSRLVLGPTQPIKWVLESLYPGVKRSGC